MQVLTKLGLEHHRELIDGETNSAARALVPLPGQTSGHGNGGGRFCPQQYFGRRRSQAVIPNGQSGERNRVIRLFHGSDGFQLPGRQRLQEVGGHPSVPAHPERQQCHAQIGIEIPAGPGLDQFTPAALQDPPAFPCDPMFRSAPRARLCLEHQPRVQSSLQDGNRCSRGKASALLQIVRSRDPAFDQRQEEQIEIVPAALVTHPRHVRPSIRMAEPDPRSTPLPPPPRPPPLPLVFSFLGSCHVALPLHMRRSSGPGAPLGA